MFRKSKFITFSFFLFFFIFFTYRVRFLTSVCHVNFLNPRQYFFSINQKFIIECFNNYLAILLLADNTLFPAIFLEIRMFLNSYVSILLFINIIFSVLSRSNVHFSLGYSFHSLSMGSSLLLLLGPYSDRCVSQRYIMLVTSP